MPEENYIYRLEKKGVLRLIIDCLLAPSPNKRISMMEAKSRELKSLLAQNGHQKTSSVIKRK